MASDEYDVVIVGGGTAGLILATRLTEDPSLQVVVLESGEDHSSNPQVLTPAMYLLLWNTALDWAFQSTPQQGNRGKPFAVPQGRMLGGSSGINGHVFAPCPKSYFDCWAELGNTGWDFEAMDRAVRKAVTVHRSSGTKEGTGPIQLVGHDSPVEAFWVKTWNDSLAELGYPPCDAFASTQTGPITNFDAVDPITGHRSFTKNAYLDPVRSRPNLTILTGSTVNKIVFREDNDIDGPVADGVLITSKDGIKETIQARKEVILSAGTINSPRLLELSGIGDKARLEGLGIDVVVDNPYVGENFQNHAYTGLVFPLKDDVETFDPVYRQEPEAMAAAMKMYTEGKGGPVGRSTTLTTAPMPLSAVTDDETANVIEAMLEEADTTTAGPSLVAPAFKEAWKAYTRSNFTSPTGSPGRFMFVPLYGPFGVDDPSYRAPGSHFTIITMLSHPFSRGSTHITTNSPDQSDKNTGVKIDTGFIAHPLDVEILTRYLMFAEKSLARLQPFASLLKPREDRFTDVEKTREYVKETMSATNHFVGTCAMMSREMGGVVDDKLRVFGCSNLRVCDASIIPVVPRNNAQATVYAVAERGADIIKETLV